MNEYAIRQYYNLLGHKGYLSRVGVLDCNTKEYKEEYIDGLNDILKYIRPFDGKRNCFISRAPINPDKSFRPASVCTFDLDPIRAAGEASTDEQHESAIQAGRRILQRYPGGVLASSGNGALLIYRFSSPITDIEEYYKKEGIFIEKVLQPLVIEFNVKVDKTNYEKAITKIIGTKSTKGLPEYHRVSRFITYPNGGSNGTSLYDAIRQIPINTIQPSTEKFEGNPVERIREAQESLNKLGKEYYEDYEKWTKVGMALKEFGISGLRLWKDWSKKSEKYKENICEEKWDTFKETPEITLGSLKYWAASNLDKRENSISSSSSDYFKGLFSKDLSDRQVVKTGISILDSVLRALPRGEITTIAARSGFGKSSWACTVAEFNRKQGKRILYFSTEMSVEYIMHKFVSIACNIPTQRLIEKTLTEEECKRIRAYEQELLRSPLTLCDEFSPKIELVKDLVEQHKPDLLIFDHATQSGTHWEYVAQFVRGLKEITAEHNIVTLLAAQLNEPPRGSNGTVGSSVRGDIRGSQEVIFLSGIFMMMNNIHDVKGDVQPVELEIAKNRFGISGIKLEIHVDKRTGLYSD